MGNEEIESDANTRRVGRWAVTVGVLGALGILTFAAFVNQIAHWLRIPTGWGYGLAVLGGIIILLLNLGVQNLSRVIYRWLVTGLLTIMAIQTVIVCLFAYSDDGLSGQSLASMGVFTIIFILTALVAWRLVVLHRRLFLPGVTAPGSIQ